MQQEKVEEIRKQLAAEVAEAKQIMEELEGLDKSPVWARLHKAYTERLLNLNQMLTSPMTSLKDAMQRNVVIGEMAGLSFALNYPAAAYLEAKNKLVQKAKIAEEGQSANIDNEDEGEWEGL